MTKETYRPRVKARFELANGKEYLIAFFSVPDVDLQELTDAEKIHACKNMIRSLMTLDTLFLPCYEGPKSGFYYFDGKGDEGLLFMSKNIVCVRFSIYTVREQETLCGE